MAACAEAEQLTWLALDELGKANLLEAEVTRPHPLSSKLTRRQMLTTFATAGVALAVVPMVALVTTQARAEALPATPNGESMTYFLKVRVFIESLLKFLRRQSLLLLVLLFLIFIVRLIQNILQESQIFI
jgi:hypothetical protein